MDYFEQLNKPYVMISLLFDLLALKQEYYFSSAKPKRMHLWGTFTKSPYKAKLQLLLGTSLYPLQSLRPLSPAQTLFSNAAHCRAEFITLVSSNSLWSFSALVFSKSRLCSSSFMWACSSLVCVC